MALVTICTDNGELIYCLHILLSESLSIDKRLSFSSAVVFYYAGHGFHKNGIDFLMPLDTGFEYNHTNENIKKNSMPRQGDCTSATRIYNIFQRTSPALLFSIYDTCRSHLCPR